MQWRLAYAPDSSATREIMQSVADSLGVSIAGNKLIKIKLILMITLLCFHKGQSALKSIPFH